ncbi:uncharacterized protein LOC100824859 [Brachypodium distachyon]|uniref:uncharacterized protein LOC100824859 n=1 Tax=Brachypodium distachyon TaxID=15368 RepID=UPI0001C7593F|nr:uncharacterized protein LOC100824859 [Brachypodium distachyon]|eukprot:XP_003560257.1 uncharacterized protein LOC100824859 [Brachypodium distachyon]
MATAPSDPAKKKFISRHGFALTAALIFLVLLFVAGSIGTLHDHHKNDPNHPRTVSRKILISIESTTDDEPPSRRPTTTGGGSNNNNPLPRGIVQRTSNLEMESMVGNPKERRQEKNQAPSKSLLAIPVGIKKKAAVDKLVSKFPADRFTVMLFHYDGALEQWGDLEWSARAVHVAAPGQTKWWFAKRFLHPDVVAEYDYVFLWDEDVELDAFDPVRYLEIVRKQGLEVSQPALDRRSEIHHAHTARRLARPSRPDGAEAHGAEWVEGMVPVFSRGAWRCAWGMVQNDLVHGWGLDYKLGYCAGGDRTATKVGVVDSEYVLHRGVPTLGQGGGNRVAVRRRSFVEMQMFDRRWEEAVAEDGSWTDPYAQPATAR